MERKIKKVNTKPLIELLNRWEELTFEEKNQLAMLMIDKISFQMKRALRYVSVFDDENRVFVVPDF